MTLRQPLEMLSLDDLRNASDADLKQFEALCDHWQQLAERELVRRSCASTRESGEALRSLVKGGDKNG